MSTSLRRALGTVATTAAAFVVLMAPSAHAVVLISEGFENAVSTMIIYGSASRDCTTAASGSCSLEVPSTTTGRSGAYDATPRLMTGPVTLSFSFMADCFYGDMDADATITMNYGSATLHVTEGNNSGVSVIGSTESRGFTSWSSAGTWYSFSLTVDPTNDTATGTFGSSSATVSIPSNASTITKIDLNGINWGSGCDIHYDAVSVTT